MNVVFVEPEGVLLSWRAAVLPQNAGLALGDIGSVGGLSAEIGLAAAYDRTAVEYLNRLCERNAAALVLVTPWTDDHSVALRSKLVAEGIAERHFHDDWACRWSRFSGGAASVRWWLQGHRTLPPDDAVVLSSRSCGLRTVKVDPVEGITVTDYRLACGYLRGVDEAYGVFAVAPEDWERADQALCSAMAACQWLHGRDWLTHPTNADLLAPLPGDRLPLGLGRGRTAEKLHADRRRLAWADLASVAPPPTPDVVERDMDF